jgi:hypothetical protein
MKFKGHITIFFFIIFTTLNFYKCDYHDYNENHDNSFYKNKRKENMVNNFIFGYFQKLTENLFEEYYKYFDGFKILMTELYKVFYKGNFDQNNEDINSEYNYKITHPSLKRERKLFNSTNKTENKNNTYSYQGNFR